MMLHLRPGGGYRGLVVHELSTSAGSPVPSATLWRLVSERGAAVPFDVRMNAWGETVDAAPGRDIAESVMLLRERDVTHVLAVPMRSADGSLTGMVTFEADCPRGTGEKNFWGGAVDELQVWIDVATPALLQLAPKAVDTRREHPLLPVVGASMSPLVALLDIFASQPETLLLTGQTGTGKSRMAAYCHAQSGRSGGPFVHLDLQTVPEEMQMAELFGWKRGAFTGAVADKPGAVERADKGTLFLDELDKLSLKAQAGLLQLLETRKWRRLGDRGGENTADVRFIVGSNIALRAAVAKGDFREDLYYRINVLPVNLPALDERADEIPGWAFYMAERRHVEGGLPGAVTVTAEAAALLAGRRWPGNLRQLDNVVRRAYAISLTGLTPDGVTLSGAHVERALAFEGSGGGAERVGGLAEALGLAARSYLGAVDPPTLDDADLFRGVLLAEAVAQFGGVKEAYVALGRESTVQSRNHQREYRKALDVVAAVLARAGARNPYAEG